MKHLAVVAPVVSTFQPDITPLQEIPTDCLLTKEQIAVDIELTVPFDDLTEFVPDFSTLNASLLRI
jgi:hypothetical protein